MTRDRVLYGLAAIAAGAIAVWAGMPPLFLLLLACPVAMMFMMGSMGGMHGGHRGGAGPVGEQDRSATSGPFRSDEPHESIDRP